MSRIRKYSNKKYTRSKSVRRRKSKNKSVRRRKSVRRKRRNIDGGLYDYILGKDRDSDDNPYERIDKNFYDAILSGNIEYVRFLIDNGGVDIDNIIFYGNTFSPLVLAVKENNVKLVNLLLDKGANVNILEDGKSILEIACELKNPYIIKSLKDYGASGKCELGPIKRVIQKEPESPVEEKPKFIRPPGSEPPEEIVTGRVENVGIKYKTYFDLLDKKIPRPAVEEKPKFIRPPGSEPPEEIVTGRVENVGITYKTYFDLLDKKIPRPAVEAKLRAAGINPSILDLDRDKPIPPGFIVDVKLIEVKKAPLAKPKSIQLKQSAVSDFWKENSSIIDTDFTKEKEKEIEKDYFTAVQKIKEAPVVVQDNKILPLLNIDPKIRQNLEIAYKKLLNIIPIKAEELNIQNINSYIKNLVMGNSSINNINESILGILYDLVPHTKDGIVETQKIKDITTLDKNALTKLENGFVFDYELFLYKLLKIDDQFDRIQVLQFKKTFPIDMKNIGTKIDLLLESIFIIQNSPELHELLKVLQKIANIGGHKGGFSLTLISSILDYKSKSNPKNTIIDYVVTFLRSINFEFSNFFNDMQILESTSTFSIQDMITTLKTAEKLNKIVENIDAIDKRYEEYLIINDEIKKVEEKLENLNNKFTELLNFYGEPEEKVDLRVYLIELNNAVKKIKNQLIIDNKRVKSKEAEFTAKNKIKE